MDDFEDTVQAVATVKTRLRHSLPLIPCEEEEHQLQSSSLLPGQTEQLESDNRLSIPVRAAATVPDTPLLAPQLVLAISQQKRVQVRCMMDIAERCRDKGKWQGLQKCVTEVTVNGHHLCGKNILRNG